MRTFTRLLVLFLGLTTATSIFYAFQQQKALRAARQTAAALEKERADLRERLRLAERNAFLPSSEAEPDSNRITVDTAPLSARDVADNSASPAAAAADAPFGGGRMPPFLDNPEAQRLMAMQQRGSLDMRYGALFRMLNLPPDQLERLKDLLVEKQTAAMDVLAAARSQGLNNRENRGEIRDLLQATQAEIDGNIRDLIGDAAYQRMQNFEQTQPQRAVVNRLEQRLSYSSIPLSPQQSEQLVQILAASVPATQQPTRMASGTFFIGSGPTISDQTIAQAATVLNSTQLDALRQLQREQQAQAELNQLFRNSRGRRGNRAEPAQPTSPATPPRG